jgi:hypothetical protein
MHRDKANDTEDSAELRIVGILFVFFLGLASSINILNHGDSCHMQQMALSDRFVIHKGNCKDMRLSHS